MSGMTRPASMSSPNKMMASPISTQGKVPLTVWIILGVAAIILIVFLALGLPSPAQLMRGTEQIVIPPTPISPPPKDDLPAIERDLSAIIVDNLDKELEYIARELKR